MAQRWLRGKALETLIALRGIQVEDEILVSMKNRPMINAQGLVPRYAVIPFRIARVDTVDEKTARLDIDGMQVGDPYYHGDFVRGVKGSDLTKNNWGVTYDEIVAWRRPKR